jgi:hypothetical protein
VSLHDDDFDEDAHAEHDDHGHPPEDPRWVLVPLAVAFVIGVVILVVLGLGSGAVPST